MLRVCFKMSGSSELFIFYTVRAGFPTKLCMLFDPFFNEMFDFVIVSIINYKPEFSRELMLECGPYEKHIGQAICLNRSRGM